MLPIIALIGRPNVGKSTLFNYLTRTRDALVANQPGLTRDRQYGVGELGKNPYVVIDTGGISGDVAGIDGLMEQQVLAAIGEADHLLLLLDAREGLNADDERLAGRLRRTGKPLSLIVNKSENLDQTIGGSDFYRLGLGEPTFIAAVHGRGVSKMINQVLDSVSDSVVDDINPTTEQAEGVKVAIIGRPNVGKSTLVNRLLGEDRVVVFDHPGTTRDAIAIPFNHNDKSYTLIDTAGVRRRARIHEVVEKFSVIKTLQAMEQANVVLFVLDAQQGVSEQDATLAGHVVSSGCALVVVMNKWDGLANDEREHIKAELQRRLPFLQFAEWHFISALHGSGVGHLMTAVDKAYQAAMIDMQTARLTDILEQAVTEHQPPLVRGRRIKLRYAHQGGKNPPLIIIHGRQTDDIPASYQRFLLNRFREALRLQGTPLRIEFRSGDNPYAGQRNLLTQRQQQRRRRMLKHVKRGRK